MYQKESKAKDRQEAEDLTSPTASIIHHAIYNEAEEELKRTNASLFWSGLAAGLAMAFSMIAEGLILSYLPKADWVPLISNLGYTVGFLIVIFGKQQLFTENTLTPILPLLHEKSFKIFVNVARLWGLVLFANLLGALLTSFVIARTFIFDPNVLDAFTDIGHKAMAYDFNTTLLKGVFAGWLIALMVWLLPYAESAKIWVIIIITYLVGLGHFTHVIVGAVETFTYALLGHATWLDVLGNYLVPTLIGNVLGGVVIVAALNHAQVKAE